MNRAVFGCLILLSLASSGVGVGMAIWLTCSIWSYRTMHSWIETPAQILKVELVESMGGEGGSSYETKAEFEYALGKVTHRGSRVDIENCGDNIGSFQQEAYRELKEHYDHKRPFRCFVNPADPAEAILYRDLRWPMNFFKMSFILVFGGAGFGIVLAGPKAARNRLGRPKRDKTAAESPWLMRPDWAAGRVVDSDKRRTIVVLFIALVWNIAATPVWLALTGLLPWPDGAGRWVAIAILPIGALLVAWAFSTVRQCLRNGDAIFQMSTVPGVIGGRLAGAIRFGGRVRPDEAFRLTLSCLRRITTSNGDESHTTDELQWQSEHEATPQTVDEDPNQSVVPVAFDIPYDVRPTDRTAFPEEIIWRLTVTSEGGGRRAVFDVPVFMTGESKPNFAQDAGFRPAGAAVQSDSQRDP